jgi:hypothetical protein
VTTKNKFIAMKFAKMKYKIMNLITVPLLITMSPNIIRSQIQKNEIIIPASTTANKFENCNIDKPNLYNGSIENDILLYEIKLKNFSLPIILSHNYNGFRPGENSSWVGLGWDIRVGGSISRVVHNAPDDSPNGYDYINDELNIPDPVKEPADYLRFIKSLTKDQLKMFAEGAYDGQPDEFMLSGSNLNAKFIKLKDGKIVTIPYRPIEIQAKKNSWVVQDEAGNTYYYGAIEEGGNAVNEQMHTGIESVSSGDYTGYDYISKYMLLKITTLSGENILFDYERENMSFPVSTSQTRSFYIEISSAGNPDNMLSPGGSTTKTTANRNGYRLVSIVTPKEQIYFNKGDLRKDLNSTDSYLLKEIEVKDKDNHLVKGWNFYSSYLGNLNKYSQCRLLLDSIAEFGKDKSKGKPSYKFLYETSSDIPEYETMGIDHWGYYNGEHNSTLVPSYLPNSSFNDRFTSFSTDRTPNHIYSRIGLLKSIQYPLGGTSSYIYEPNTYGYIDNDPIENIVYRKESLNINASATSNTVVKKDTFSLTNKQVVHITYFLNPNTASSGTGISVDQDPAYFKITKVGETSNKFYKVATMKNVSGTDSIPLDPGSYNVEIYANPNQLVYGTIDYLVEKKDAAGNNIINKTITTAGHRLKQIILQDGNKTVNKYFGYQLAAEKDRSSGVLVGIPDYEYAQTVMNVSYARLLPLQYPDLHIVLRTSNSIRPISSDDSHICYSEISEYGDADYKTVSYFTSSLNYPDYLFPRGTNISKAYKRGLLTRSVNLDKDSKLVSSVMNNYDFHKEDNKDGIAAIMLVEYLHQDISPSLSTYMYPWSGTILSEWIPLESMEQEKDGVKTKQSYYYDNPAHAQTTRSLTDTGNKAYCTFTLYPDDYASANANDFIGAMKSRHIIGSPIEQIKCVKDTTSGALYVVGGEIYTYKTGNQAGLAESTYRMVVPKPIPLSSFKFSNCNSAGESPYGKVSPGSFSITNIDSMYSKVPETTILQYDPNNNVREIMDKDNVHVCYLWWGGQYPVAEIKNMDYSTLENAIGKSLVQDIQLGADLENGKMEVINSLRTNPLYKNAQIATYTYRPLVGMTSATAPNGVTTYYEYDTFNRLKRTYIKENDVEKTVQSYDYHYKQ